jgi:hypothetical protein
MKIESKFSILEVLEDNLIFKNKVVSRYKKGIYNFKIVNVEDIERLKEFFNKFNKSKYINFYYDFENEKIEIELENVKNSKIKESIELEILDIN